MRKGQLFWRGRKIPGNKISPLSPEAINRINTYYFYFFLYFFPPSPCFLLSFTLKIDMEESFVYISGFFPFIQTIHSSTLSLSECLPIPYTSNTNVADPLPGRPDEFTRLVPFLHHGSLLFAVSSSSAVTIFESRSETKSVLLSRFSSEVRSRIDGLEVIASPDVFSSPRVISGDWGGRVCVWETEKLDESETGLLREFTDGEIEVVYCMRYEPLWSLSEVIVAGQPAQRDGVVALDLERLEITQKYTYGASDGYSDFVSLAMDIPGNGLFAAGEGKRCRMWDRLSCRVELNFQTLYPGYSLFFDEERQLLYVGEGGGHVEVFDPRKSTQNLLSFCPGSEYLWDLDQVNNSTFVSVGESRSHQVAFWTPTGKIRCVLSLPDRCYGCRAFPKLQELEDPGVFLERFGFVVEILCGETEGTISELRILFSGGMGLSLAQSLTVPPL